MKQQYTTPEMNIFTYRPEEMISTSFGENTAEPF